VNKELFEKDAYIFPVKDALMYIPSGGHSAQGATYFRAPNPEYGATFTYYLKEVPKTLKAERKEKEKPLFKDGKPIPQPTLEALHEEALEIAPYLIFKITDETGNVVRKITKSASAGINRVNWDLRYEGTSPVTTEKFEPVAPVRVIGRRGGGGGGILSMPGKYKVSLSIVAKDQEKELVPPTEFNVVPLNNTTLPAKNRGELVAFQKKAAELARTAYGAQRVAEDLVKRTEAIKQALNNTPSASFALFNRAMDISKELDKILITIRGREGRGASAEENPPAPVTLSSRLQTMLFTSMRTTTNITKNQTVAYEDLYDEIQPIIEQLKKISEVDLKAIETEMEKLNVPWTPGRMPELKK
ncbi:MAG: glycosyl hydrolase, partial [Melioribacteraceae bacterium]